MTVILAIDAAWTATNPSGVALISSDGSRWRCAAVAPSYGAFLDLAGGNPFDWARGRFAGGAANVANLLAAAEVLGRAPVDLVAIDMPIATIPITGRRVADNLVSQEYGGQGCSTHSPSTSRPGELGATLSKSF